MHKISEMGSSKENGSLFPFDQYASINNIPNGSKLQVSLDTPNQLSNNSSEKIEEFSRSHEECLQPDSSPNVVKVVKQKE